MGDDNGTGTERGRALDRLRSLIREVEDRLQGHTTKCSVVLYDAFGEALGQMIWRRRRIEDRWALLFRPGVDEHTARVEPLGNTPVGIRLAGAKELGSFVRLIRHRHATVDEIDEGIDAVQRVLDSLDFTIPIGEAFDEE